MKPVSAWSLVKLVALSVLFTWRMDAWAATRSAVDGAMALAWAVWALSVAYNIWAQSREG